ncbi:MAG TPA: hypothetical protein VFY40_21565 [Blastocatellia bacterium]|nr:hypothetical protein [Blastocatellia bacterium]
MRFLRGIAIAIIAILLALFLAAYRPWWSGANHRETGSTGAVNPPQNNTATGAQNATQPQHVPNVNQSVNDLRQAAREARQAAREARQAANEARKGARQRDVYDRSAMRPAKSAKRSTAEMREAVEWETEDCECEEVETQGVEQVIIWPTIRPTTRPTTTRINITVPVSQECPTPYYEVWAECCDP